MRIAPDSISDQRIFPTGRAGQRLTAGDATLPWRPELSRTVGLSSMSSPETTLHHWPRLVRVVQRKDLNFIKM